MSVNQICEAVMMLTFGASWPMQIIKTVRVKNPAGKSFLFMWLILTGYLAGIVNKLLADQLDPVVWLYVLNIAMVAVDLALSYHYLRRLRNKS